MGQMMCCSRCFDSLIPLLSGQHGGRTMGIRSEFAAVYPNLLQSQVVTKLLIHQQTQHLSPRNILELQSYCLFQFHNIQSYDGAYDQVQTKLSGKNEGKSREHLWGSLPLWPKLMDTACYLVKVKVIHPYRALRTKGNGGDIGFSVTPTALTSS